MLKRNILPILLIFTAIGLGLVLTPVAYAQQCAGEETAVLQCDGDGEEAILSIVRQVIRIMTGGVGILAVGSVVAGGILYAMSGKSPDRIQKAKTIWNNTVIGLVIYAFFVAITNFLIPGGVFG